jgi:hypothetical protein
MYIRNSVPYLMPYIQEIIDVRWILQNRKPIAYPDTCTSMCTGNDISG